MVGLWMVHHLVMTNIAMEDGPFIVDSPIKHGDFQFAMLRIVKIPEGTYQK